MAKPRKETRYLIYPPHRRSLGPGEPELLRTPGIYPQDWFKWNAEKAMFVYQGRPVTESEYNDLLADLNRMDRLVRVVYGGNQRPPRWFLAVMAVEIEIDPLAEKAAERSRLPVKASPELAA